MTKALRCGKNLFFMAEKACSVGLSGIEAGGKAIDGFGGPKKIAGFGEFFNMRCPVAHRHAPYVSGRAFDGVSGEQAGLGVRLIDGCG